MSSYVYPSPNLLSRVISLFVAQKMNERFFAGRRIEASLWGGKARFRRSGYTDDVEGEGDAAEKKRLDEFAQWLLSEGD